MRDLLRGELEPSAVLVRETEQPLTLVDLAREDGIRMQGISAADQRALGEWAARVALGRERQDSAAGRHEQ